MTRPVDPRPRCAGPLCDQQGCRRLGQCRHNPTLIADLVSDLEARDREIERLREQLRAEQAHIADVERKSKHVKERARRAAKANDANVRAMAERLAALAPSSPDAAREGE
jgi:hypothetical protein